jgi:hypothetical protein
MPTDLDPILQHIKLQTNYQTNKIILREKIQTDLHFTYAGGLFKVTPELIAFTSVWPDEDFFLEDSYQNPIPIKKTEFLTIATQHYQKVMNFWNIEHDKIKKLRKV